MRAFYHTFRPQSTQFYSLTCEDTGASETKYAQSTAHGQNRELEAMLARFLIHKSPHLPLLTILCLLKAYDFKKKK